MERECSPPENHCRGATSHQKVNALKIYGWSAQTVVGINTVKERKENMEHLKCPRIESSEYLCDREASYYIDGIVYCVHHARRVMEGKEGELNGNN